MVLIASDLTAGIELDGEMDTSKVVGGTCMDEEGSCIGGLRELTAEAGTDKAGTGKATKNEYTVRM